MEIKEIFKKYPLQVKGVSVESGISHTRVSNWIHGISRPRNPEDIMRIQTTLRKIGKELSKIKITNTPP